MKETLVIKEDGIPAFAERVVELLSKIKSGSAKVILLDGDLGAGKTTFTKELANALGIDKTKVNSPTFILKKEYQAEHPSFRKLIHIDAYRFNTMDEAKVLRLDDDLQDGNTIVAIEWPTKMKAPKADVQLLFTIIDDDTREVAIQYDDEILV